MNHLKKQLLCLASLVSPMHLTDATTTNIVPRSQSFNAARQIVGWNNPEWGINRLPQDEYYSSFNIIFEYTRTFRDNRLAYALFGNDLVCGECDETAITISGSAVPNRNGETDWLADYFGLPRDYQSTVSFKPSITNYILDFSFYAGLDAWVEGMYFKLYGPFVHTRWNLHAREKAANDEAVYTGSYFQGYFSSADVPTSNLNPTFLAYANGAVPTINNDYDSYGENYCIDGIPPFGMNPPYLGTCSSLGDITWNPLCCSRIMNDCNDCNDTTRNGFGELRFVLGYNFLNDENGDYHLGLGLYGAAPTGTRVGDGDCGSGSYLFEPIVGNGKHWELGGQITAHHIWWRSEDENRSFGLYVEANVTHLFSTSQIRCLDLCSAGNNSRYMLAQRLDSNRNSSPLLDPSVDTLGLEFANEYAPVANLTRRAITSSIGAQGDVAFSFAYQSGNFQWDVGYNFWGRTCEKLSLKNDCCCPDLGQWTLKGDQRVYGFDSNRRAELSLTTKLAVSDSQATIHEGSNLRHNVDYTETLPLAPVNRWADNPTRAQADFDDASTFMTTLPLGTDMIFTSNEPIFIQESDFDLSATRGISNKFFTHFNYAWPEYRDSKWTPYAGIGAEVEFGSGHRSKNSDCGYDCSNECNDCGCNPPPIDCPIISSCCENVALTQWGIWLKIGTSYN